MATSYQDDYMKTALRLPRALHAKIQEAAAASGKSLNSELIARLEQSFSGVGKASAEALMLEMRRTQLLLRRSQIQSDASRVFFSGGADARKEKAYRDTNPDPAEVQDAGKKATSARLAAAHLRAEGAVLDGQLLEIDRRLKELGYTTTFSAAEDPTDHAERSLIAPSSR